MPMLLLQAFKATLILTNHYPHLSLLTGRKENFILHKSPPPLLRQKFYTRDTSLLY